MQVNQAPPNGTVIEVDEVDGELTLRWEDRAVHPTRRGLMAILGLVILIIPFQVFGFFIMVYVMNQQPHQFLPIEPPIEVEFFFAAIMLLIWSMLVFSFYKLWNNKLGQSVAMTAETFEFDPGPKPIPNWIEYFCWSMFAGFHSWLGSSEYDYITGSDRPKKPIQSPWIAIDRFKLERVGERQRLTFDAGALRIEIGRTLSEPEREWLADELIQIHKLYHPAA